jgi:hypothetical protein
MPHRQLRPRCRLSTGSAPGRPSVTGSMFVFGLVAETVRRWR